MASRTIVSNFEAGMAVPSAVLLDNPRSCDPLPLKRVDQGTAGTGAWILIVDDEPYIRVMLREMLEPAGYHTFEAADGIEAMKRIADEVPDLAIVDLVMPEQEGLTTIREARKRHPALGLIAISGAFGGQLLKAARLMGAHEVLCKPLRRQLVLDTVRVVLGRPRGT